MTTILETERLTLRTWSLDDAEAGFQIWSDAEVMLYVGTGEPYKSVEQTRSWLRRMIAHQEQYGFGYWAMLEKESGQLIGSCGMGRHPDGGPAVDFGYTLARSHWGRGLATEAAAACLSYAFEHLRLPELVASVDSRNTRSQRVLEKIGFVFERQEQLESGVDFWYVATRARNLCRTRVGEDRK
ncbi:MAG TPA: GNAT family N-acetyltransferase [Pyrinomonadaceae bacterium]